jgi:hypothetical protein
MTARVPALGSQTALVCGFETTYGTIAGAGTGKKFGFMKAGIKGTKSLIDNMTLTSDPNLRDAIRGRQNAGGPLSFYLDPINAPFVLKAALGSLASSGGTNYVHTLKMGAAQPPSFTTEEAFTFVDASGVWVQALGCLIDSLKLSGKVDGYLEADCTILAAKTQKNESATQFTTTAATKATSVLTSTGTIPADNDTVKIGAKTYRFKTVMASINDVLIGSDANDALFNLKAAVIATNDEGVLWYTGTTANADFTATTLTSTTLVLEALVAGVAANALDSTTPVGTTLSFPGATFAAGTPGVDAIAGPADWTANPNPFENMMIAAADVKLGTMGSPAAFTGITEWGITVNNNLFKNDYRVGQVGARTSSTRSKARVEVNLKCMFEDMVFYNMLTSTANTPVEFSVKYSINANTYLTIRLPRLFLEWNDPGIDSGDPVTIDAKGVAAYDSSTASSIVVTVGNQSAGSVYA